MRPGYITRCPKCGERLIAVDTYETSKWDDKKKCWITRLFDPDFVLAAHIAKHHS